MIRILGAIVGAFLAASALVLFLGIPEFHRPGADDAGQARMIAAIENAQSKWEERAPPEPALVDTGAPDTPPEASATGGDVLPPSPDDGAPAVPAAVLVDDTPFAPPAWHAIWAPFRTEIAARGFISRLESVTGLDYRVEKQGKGAWQVAFAYGDETERDAGLAQIAAATGLDLSADRR